MNSLAMITICVVAFLSVVGGFIFTLYKVDMLEKKVNILEKKLLDLDGRMGHEKIDILRKLQSLEELVEKTIDHSHDVLISDQEIVEKNTELVEKIKEVLKEDRELTAQTREVLNNNIRICEMNEDLQKSCQQLLKIGSETKIDET